MNAKNVRRISSLNKEILSREASKFLLKCILEKDQNIWEKWQEAFLKCQIANYPEDFKSEADLKEIELRLFDLDIEGIDLLTWKGSFTLAISYRNDSKEKEDLAKVKSILNGQTFLESLRESGNERLLREFFKKIKDSFLKQDKNEWEAVIEKFFVLLKKEFPETFKTKNDLSLIELSLNCKNLNQKDRSEYYCWNFPFEVVISISGNINFSKAEFLGGSRFEFNEGSTALFCNTKFYEIATFSGFSFDKSLKVKALFQGSYFVGGASFYGISFSPDSYFSSCQFYGLEKVPTKEVLNKVKDYSKSNTYYNNDIVFKDSSFDGFVDFSCSAFFTNADFRSAKFSSDASFWNVQFFDSIEMFSNATFEGKVTFEGAKFQGDVLLDLSEAVFKGPSTHFTKSLTNKEDEKYLGLKEIKAHHTIFECPAIFDLKFQSCPDFSKTHFLKYVSIEETWLKEGETIDCLKIKKEEVGKFRFFKNYFKEKGNHFKENEYFSYEMKAVEKAKRCELNLLQGKGFFNCQRWGKRFALSRWKLRYERFAQKVRGFFNCQRWKKRLAISRWNLRWERLVQEAKRLFNGQRWKKRLSCGRWQLRCTRLCKRMDFWLFKIYRIVSDYGMSVSRPFVSILVSIVFFSFVFSCHFQKEFIKKPSEKFLAFYNFSTINHLEQNSVILREAKDLVNLKLPSQAHEILRFAQNDGVGVWDNKNNAENDKSVEDGKVSWGQIAAKTFLLTINPFGVFKFLESSSNALFIFIVGIQSLLNTALLFLLALGIRNRFKVK